MWLQTFGFITLLLVPTIATAQSSSVVVKQKDWYSRFSPATSSGIIEGMFETSTRGCIVGKAQFKEKTEDIVVTTAHVGRGWKSSDIFWRGDPGATRVGEVQYRDKTLKARLVLVDKERDVAVFITGNKSDIPDDLFFVDIAYERPAQNTELISADARESWVVLNPFLELWHRHPHSWSLMELSAVVEAGYSGTCLYSIQRQRLEGMIVCKLGGSMLGDHFFFGTRHGCAVSPEEIRRVLQKIPTRKY